MRARQRWQLQQPGTSRRPSRPKTPEMSTGGTEITAFICTVNYWFCTDSKVEILLFCVLGGFFLCLLAKMIGKC